MAKILFDRQGHYLLGRHKGTHVSNLEPSFVQWASLNIDGFKAQYATLARGESLPEPRISSAKAFTEGPPKRKYFLSKTRRMFTPKPPHE